VGVDTDVDARNNVHESGCIMYKGLIITKSH
jgi:hypothetical protein